jgi:predicted DNA-binding antitoxin AbrB/MazE fold protein
VDTLRLEVVYEHGTLRLPHELPLQDGERVTITIHASSAAERLSGSLPWAGDPEELRRFLDDQDQGQWGSRDV